ncbi:MAG: DNA polymerase III subunit delta' [Pseudomonadota bacterium]
MDNVLPEADALDGYTHPRFTPNVFGHEHAEEHFLSTWRSGRLHHAVLITGPKGIGKASFVWRAARFLLDPVSGATNLATDPESPVNRRISALSEPRLVLARRGWDEKAKKLRTQITVDDIRGFKSFFQLSVTDGGWRAAIIDAADEMNTAAANALLKILEEPPEKTVIFLVSHQPTRLLPTIRSRCTTLPLTPLSGPAMEAALRQQDVLISPKMDGLTAMANGSVGQALRLIEAEGQDIYAAYLSAFDGIEMDRSVALKLAESCAGPQNNLRYDITLELLSVFLSRIAHQGSAGTGALLELAPGEARVLNRLGRSQHHARRWADLALALPARAAQSKAVNLDPSSVILDMLLEIDKTAKA